MQDSIRGLSTLERNGYTVGRLKFKSEVNSIPLIQYGMTWSVKGNRVRIQKVSSKLKVNGLKQIPKDAELTSACLCYRNGDYYLHVTCFLLKVEREFETEEALGIDFGIKNQLTLSNGIRVNYQLPKKVEQLERTHRELSRKTFRSSNYLKSKLKLNKQYEHLNNIKKDARNKIVSRLTSTFPCICIQSDVIKGWQKLFGKRVFETSIGEIRRVLQTHTHTLVVVDTFFPSTQLCSVCDNRQSIGLDDRVYTCDCCSSQMDRDLNAAINIRNQGLSQLDVPMDHRDVKPVETIANTLIAYLNSVRGVSASYVCEAGR
jgi:putative transposase